MLTSVKLALHSAMQQPALRGREVVEDPGLQGLRADRGGEIRMASLRLA